MERVKKKRKIPENVQYAQTVRICGTPKGTILTEKYCRQVGALKNLRALILENIIIKDGTLKSLCVWLPKLNELVMATTSTCLTNETCFDTNLGHLKKFPELQAFRCIFKDITDVGLSTHVIKLKKLYK